MEAPALHKLRADFAQLQTEMETMITVAPNSYLVVELRERVERVRTEMESLIAEMQR
jgi:hypothetical protein